jgi:hypothetical protein
LFTFSLDDRRRVGHALDERRRGRELAAVIDASIAPSSAADGDLGRKKSSLDRIALLDDLPAHDVEIFRPVPFDVPYAPLVTRGGRCLRVSTFVVEWRAFVRQGRSSGLAKTRGTRRR